MVAEMSYISEQDAKRPSLVLGAISSHLKQLGYPERSLLSMNKCGLPSGLEVFKQCLCGVSRIQMTYKCNLRTCPTCAKTRKKRIFNRFLPFFNLYPITKSNFFQFLTISPPNYKNLEEGFKHIRKSFSKFIRRKYIKERIKAGFYVLETKEKEDGTWNIHIHAILYGRWLDYRLRGQCLDCHQNLIKFDKTTKIYFCASRSCNSLNVVRYTDTKTGREWAQSSGDVARIYGERVNFIYGAVSYLTKYISANKDDFFSSESVAKYIFSTHKKKLINAFGLFFKESRQLKNNSYCCYKCNTTISYFIDFQVTNMLNNLDPPDFEAQKSVELFFVSEPKSI